MNTITMIEELRRFNNLLPELRKISKKINNLDCARCNGTIDEDKYEDKLMKLFNRAEVIGDNFGLIAYHQSDPRGCSLYLIECGMEDRYTDGIAIV